MSTAINEISSNGAAQIGKKDQAAKGGGKSKNNKPDNSDAAIDSLKSQVASQTLFLGTPSTSNMLQSSSLDGLQSQVQGEQYSSIPWMWRFMMQLFQWLGMSLAPQPATPTTPSSQTFDPNQYAKDYVARNGERNVMSDLVLAFGSQNKTMKNLAKDLLDGKDLKKSLKHIKAGNGEEEMMKLLKEFGAEKIVALLTTKLGKDDFESTISQFYA